MQMNGCLTAIGTSCIDEYYDLEEVPRLGDKVICRYIESRPGGMIGNAVCVYASYNTPSYMIDFISVGSHAEMLLDDLKNYGVNTEYIIKDSSRPDTKCIVMLKNGERIIFVIENHKKDLLLSDEQIDLLNKSEFVYTTVAEILTLRSYSNLVDDFRCAGAKLVLDIEGNTIVDTEAVLDILGQGDILFINESGLERINVYWGKDFIQKLSKNGALVVLTLGPQGCQVLEDGKKSPVLPALDVKVVDTTGAGDTFNASFLYGLHQGWDMMEVAIFANAAASRAVTVLGARSGAVGEKEVREFMRGNYRDIR
jgi:ribokinase